MKNDKGFTFAETIIVLAIVLILSASIGMSATKYVHQARESAAVNDISIYSNALHMYYMDCGVFPSEYQGLAALWSKPEIHPVPNNWQGPYISKKPRADPWGNDYIYMTENESGLPFSIMSLGADSVELGGETDDNIYSWK